MNKKFVYQVGNNKKVLVLLLERGGSSAVVRGWASYNRPDHNQQHCYHHAPTVNQRLLLQLL
jgi:hypothetical protein